MQLTKKWWSLLRPQDQFYVLPVPGAHKHAKMNLRRIVSGTEERECLLVLTSAPPASTVGTGPCVAKMRRRQGTWRG